MNSKTQCIFGIAFLVLISASSFNGQEQSANGVINQWIATLDELQGGTIQCTLKYGDPLKTHRSNVQFDSGHHASQVSIDDSGIHYLRVSNSTYIANCIRHANENWILENLTLITDSSANKDFGTYSFRTISQANEILHHLLNKNYSVTEFSETQLENRPFWCLEIEIQKKELDDLAVSKCRAWFPKEHKNEGLLPHWLESTSNNQKVAMVAFEDWQSQPVLQLELPRKMNAYSCKFEEVKGKPAGTFEFEYEQFTEPRDPKKYYLSYYGLPEPDGSALSGSRNIIRWILGATLVLSIAITLFWFANKRR